MTSNFKQLIKRFRFKDNVEKTELELNVLSFILNGRTISYSNLTKGIKKTILSLFEKGSTLDEIMDKVMQEDGFQSIPKINYYLRNLEKNGFIIMEIGNENQTYCRIEPKYPSNVSLLDNLKQLPFDSSFELSKYSYIHKEDRRIYLDSPLSPIQVEIIVPVLLNIVCYVKEPLTIRELGEKVEDEQFINMVFPYLLSANIVVTPNEHEHDVFRLWEFHDVLFHSRSRLGKHRKPYGGTFPFVGEIKPEPARKELPSYVQKIYLKKPNQKNPFWANDQPFGKVVETRRSVRIHGKKPITDQQLSEFLYRSLHVTEHFIGKHELEVTKRPYPAGGSMHELELYLVINKCQGILPGIYYYDSMGHCLYEIESSKDQQMSLLRQASMIAKMDEKVPQIYIMITSRFSRLAWKYRSMAYSLTLKNLGALYQTMYLNASALNLAACALGGGDIELFQSITKIDCYKEPFVGEFILGSLNEDTNH